MTTTKGVRASARPPPQLRTPTFARHSRRIVNRNRASGRFEGRKFRRARLSGPSRNPGAIDRQKCRLHISQLVCFVMSRNNTQDLNVDGNDADVSSPFDTQLQGMHIELILIR